MRRIGVAVGGIALWCVAGCRGDRQGSAITSEGTGGDVGTTPEGAAGTGGDNGTAGTGGTGGTAGGTPPSARGCSDVFDPATLVDYSFDISADEWAKIDYEFRNRDALKAAGVDYKTFHPIVFHYGNETVTDAMVRLKGDSSWVITVRNDGDKARMQFVVSFEEINPAGKFHGVSKLVFDMPNEDDTFLMERVGFTAMAEIFGMAAPCANSARVTINGQYYGLYVAEEHVGGGYIKRVFPEAPNGDLFQAGDEPKTNETMPNKAKLAAFWAAHDIGSMAAVVDMQDSVDEWAAEALLNDADGYYNGAHNWYIYDYADKGYRWLLDDADATFGWLGRSDVSPIYWWAGRSTQQDAGQHYLIVMADPTWRANYIAALRRLLALWDVGRVQGWIDTFSAQIESAVEQDPHRTRSMDDHHEAVAEMRRVAADRPAYIAKFLGCEDGSGDASDADGDGFAWCNDCDDANAAVNPAAVEICGNGIDDNCNRYADTQDGCPAM
jgi:hypothetical protein